jgi:IS605 OrfB family transposase
LAGPVTVKVNVPKVENLTQPTIIGVDLGLNSLAAAVAMSSNGHILPAKVVSGRRLKHQLNILWGKRRAASRKNLIEKIETIDKKTRNVIQYWVNVAAKTVIRYAIQFSQPIIALEDLRSYLPTRKGTPWAKPQLRDQLSKWARGEIGRAIKRNSALEGIPTVFVDAAYSSHICPRGCLCLLTRNPKTNRTRTYFRIFRCPNCGVQLPRDINAAIEIAKRGLHLIKERVQME